MFPNVFLTKTSSTSCIRARRAAISALFVTEAVVAAWVAQVPPMLESCLSTSSSFELICAMAVFSAPAAATVAFSCLVATELARSNASRRDNIMQWSAVRRPCSSFTTICITSNLVPWPAPSPSTSSTRPRKSAISDIWSCRKSTSFRSVSSTRRDNSLVKSRRSLTDVASIAERRLESSDETSDLSDPISWAIWAWAVSVQRFVPSSAVFRSDVEAASRDSWCSFRSSISLRSMATSLVCTMLAPAFSDSVICDFARSEIAVNPFAKSRLKAAISVPISFTFASHGRGPCVSLGSWLRSSEIS
mmetsp:Transcript_61835/g.172693  ORF Transcript_61835/g.172693 Transcript_61835/m.172693 type:complete len:304 (-) Transcript_61835:170-1081(-)